MPTARSPDPTCVFTEGKRRCRRRGTGNPALCEPHRAALDVVAGRQGGFGEQLGTLLDTVLSGRKPTAAQVDRTMASLASSVLRRPVTVEEFRQTRQQVQRGQWDAVAGQVRSSASGRSPSAPPPGPDPAEQQRQQAEAHAKSQAKARLHDIAYARKILGIGPRTVLTEDLIKTQQRVMARKHHPDRGGSTQAMQDVNHAVEILRSTL